jgi:hypothetical protein
VSKRNLTPMPEGKGLLEVKGRRPATGESLVDLSDPQADFQAVAGESRTRTNRLTSALVRTPGRAHDDDPHNIWTSQSNVIASGNYTGWNTGTDSTRTAANPVGTQRPQTLEGGSDNPKGR